MYNIYMLSWDDVGGKRLLSTARTQDHADDLVDECLQFVDHFFSTIELPVLALNVLKDGRATA